MVNEAAYELEMQENRAASRVQNLNNHCCDDRWNCQVETTTTRARVATLRVATNYEVAKRFTKLSLVGISRKKWRMSKSHGAE